MAHRKNFKGYLKKEHNLNMYLKIMDKITVDSDEEDEGDYKATHFEHFSIHNEKIMLDKLKDMAQEYLERYTSSIEVTNNTINNCLV